MTPIITHPERNPILARQPERMVEWLKAGALIQVTASSLTGRFGQAAEQAAFWLMDHHWVHFLATDAHNIESRPPQLRPAFDLVAEQYDLATAERLCIANPRAAFYGEALGPQPEPAAPHTYRLAPLGTAGEIQLFRPALRPLIQSSPLTIVTVHPAGPLPFSMYGRSRGSPVGFS